MTVIVIGFIKIFNLTSYFFVFLIIIPSLITTWLDVFTSSNTFFRSENKCLENFVTVMWDFHLRTKWLPKSNHRYCRHYQATKKCNEQKKINNDHTKKKLVHSPSWLKVKYLHLECLFYCMLYTSHNIKNNITIIQHYICDGCCCVVRYIFTVRWQSIYASLTWHTKNIKFVRKKKYRFQLLMQKLILIISYLFVNFGR